MKGSLIALAAMTMAACSKNESTSGSGGGGTSYTAEKPSGIMSSISSAVAALGTDLTQSSLNASSSSGDISASLTSSDCDSHGQPNSGTINQSISFKIPRSNDLL